MFESIPRKDFRRCFAILLLGTGCLCLILLFLAAQERNQIHVRSQVYLQRLLEDEFPQYFLEGTGVRIDIRNVSVKGSRAAVEARLKKSREWIVATLQLERHDVRGWIVTGVLDIESNQAIEESSPDMDAPAFQSETDRILRTAFEQSEGVTIQRF